MFHFSQISKLKLSNWAYIFSNVLDTTIIIIIIVLAVS
jgi:hypothetical protein